MNKAVYPEKLVISGLKRRMYPKAKKEENFQEFVHREVNHQKLLKENAKLKFENEGLNLAMELHGVKKTRYEQEEKRKP